MLCSNPRARQLRHHASLDCVSAPSSIAHTHTLDTHICDMVQRTCNTHAQSLPNSRPKISVHSHFSPPPSSPSSSCPTTIQNTTQLNAHTFYRKHSPKTDCIHTHTTHTTHTLFLTSRTRTNKQQQHQTVAAAYFATAAYWNVPKCFEAQHSTAQRSTTTHTHTHVLFLIQSPPPALMTSDLAKCLSARGRHQLFRRRPPEVPFDSD